LERFRNEIDAFRDTYRRTSVHRQLKRATELTAQEYGNRFLIELIQNAHDALEPRRRDGRILVLLDLSEGTHGTLYVANTGLPFTHESFGAICEFAQSSKLPGESIGNKGIGFRSILQIADRPEIYSRDPHRGPPSDFDGYCFRFAHREDIVDYVRDPQIADAIIENVSPYSLPYPEEGRPPNVQTMAAGGYASAVRLPLRSTEAAAEAAAEVEACFASEAPLPLFLDRLELLELEVRDQNGVRRTRITRSVKSLAVRPLGKLSLSRVTIRYTDDQGEHRVRFLVASELVPEPTMLEMIELSIAQRRLPNQWLGWKHEGRVSVAIRDVGTPVSRLYNYLPMGSTAESPFPGFLDAPFFSQLNRTSLHPDVPLNDFLLNRGTSVCLKLAETLAGTHSLEYGPLVARLLAWGEKDRPRLLSVSDAEGKPLTARRVIPVAGGRSGRQRYATLGDTYTWEPAEPTGVFSAAQLAKWLAIGFLDARVDDPARSRLAAMRMALCGADFTPPAERFADWAERLAKVLLGRRAALKVWDAFYADLATVFAPRGHAELLRGRRLLLDEKGELLPAGTAGAGSIRDSEPVVFLPPVRTRMEDEEEVSEGADIEIPPSLAPFIRYTHPQLRWQDPETEASTRPFFAEHRLVRRFRRRELRELLRSVLASDRDHSVYAAALEFAYRLTDDGTEQSAPKSAELNLRVPTQSGEWLPAPNAVFSSSWGTSDAASLEDLLRMTAKDSAELRAYQDDLLAVPERWPFPIDVSSFGKFLAGLGVKDGLWPTYHQPATTRRTGYEWHPQWLAREVGLSPEAAAAWEADVGARRETFSYYSQPYELDSLPVLPGQDTYSKWSSAARERFAEIVATGLGRWDDSAFWCEFSKPAGNRDNKRWPSPMMAFLTRVPWVPVASVPDTGVSWFRTPQEAWFIPEDGRGLPEFIPAVRLPVRRAILRSATGKTRLRDLLRARYWDDESDAAAAVSTLGGVLADGALDDAAHGLFTTIYQQKWRLVMARGRAEEVEELVRSTPLVVRRAGRLSVWRAAEPDGPLVLVNEVSPLRRQLIGDTEAAVFTVDPLEISVRAGLERARRALGDQARLSSEITSTVMVDGQEFAPSDALPRLQDGELAAAAELSALFLAARAQSLSQSKREAAMELLLRVRLAPANEIAVTVAGLGDTATSPVEALAYPHDTWPTLILSRNLLQAGRMPYQLAHPLCELMGLALDPGGLELTFRRASDRTGQEYWGPEATVLPDAVACHALEVTQEHLRELRGLILRPFSACLRLLLPVMSYGLADNWSDEWHARISATRNVDELRALWVPVESSLPPFDDVIEACRAESSLGDVRDRLHLDYGRFNAALRRLGAGYHPLTDPEGQQRAVAAFMARAHTWIDDELRRWFHYQYVEALGLEAYISARAREGLDHDPAWLDEYRVPPDSLIEQHVREWLATRGQADREDLHLEPLDAVRQSNKVFLDKCQDRLRDTVAAWVAVQRGPLPDWWSQQIPGTSWLASAAHAEGWSDFEVLSEESLLRQLEARGRWPTGMPRTTVLSALGLSEADLRPAGQSREADKQRREQARRTVVVDGVRIEVGLTDFRAVADALLPGLGPDLIAIPDRVARLSEIGGTGRRGAQPGSGGRGRISAPTDEQRLAIGFAGELVVREWLRGHYPDLDIDECWRSTYKNDYLGRSDGDDTLGYDFEVITRARRRLYEVKASIGDEWQFALGESEVRVAQRSSAEGKTRYRVIYVAHALESAARRLLVLPNPLTRGGAARLRMVGAGMRFTFQPG
jgi:hypothetical protein